MTAALRRTRSNRRVKAALAGGAFFLLSLAARAETVSLAFTPADILGWRPETFQGETLYEAADVDAMAAVRASCKASASGLVLERRIDLAKTPVVEWSWGIEGVFDGEADEARKEGDDYPARLYFVKKGGLNPFATRAINYVWASAKPVGADWPNAYTSKAHIVAVRSGPPQAAMGWVTERRNLREDFQRYHGLDIDAIDAVAIMTDCDNRAAMASAWYGGVRILPEEGQPKEGTKQ